MDIVIFLYMGIWSREETEYWRAAAHSNMSPELFNDRFMRLLINISDQYSPLLTLCASSSQSLCNPHVECQMEWDCKICVLEQFKFLRACTS